MFVPARTSVLIVLTLWLLPWAESAGSGPVESEGDVAVTRLIAQWMAIGDDDLQAFYAARAMRPAWRDANVVAALAAAIATLDDDGLVPGDYHPETLLGAYHDAHAAQPRADALARFDIELSRLLITVLHHLASGKVDPAAIDPDWDLPRTAPLLDFAVVSQAVDARQFETVFATARPGHALYAGLRTGLARYRDLERRGGWGTLPARAAAAHRHAGRRCCARAWRWWRTSPSHPRIPALTRLPRRRCPTQTVMTTGLPPRCAVSSATTC